MATLKWDQRNIIAGGAALCTILICGLPLVWLAVDVSDSSAWVPKHWPGDIFRDSLVLAASASVIGLLLGGVSAWLLNQLTPTAMHPLLLTLSLPIFLPSYLHALAWSTLLSDSLLASAPGAPGPAFSSLLAVWVLAISYFPVAMLVLVAALQRWDRRFEWVSWVHGRGPKAVAMLKARYLGGHAVAAGLIIFLLAFADFAIPDFFQVRTYSTDVFVKVSSYLDVASASVLSLPVVLTTVVAFAGLARLVTRISASAPPAKPNRQPGTSRLSTIVIVPSCVLLGLLVTGVPIGGLLGKIESISLFLQAFEMIWPDALTGSAIAGACALLAVVVAILGTYGCDRGVQPSGSWLRLLPMATFAVPASLLGLAFIGLWNRPYPVGWLYDTGVVLVMAVTARWLPVSFELFAHGWRQIATEQEAAGVTGGRSWLVVLRKISLPRLAPTATAAFVVTFIFSFNELTLVTLLAPPGLSTLPLRVFQTVHYGPQSLLAAICVWQILILIVPLGLLFAVSRLWQRRQK